MIFVSKKIIEKIRKIVHLSLKNGTRRIQRLLLFLGIKNGLSQIQYQ